MIVLPVSIKVVLDDQESTDLRVTGVIVGEVVPMPLTKRDMPTTVKVIGVNFDLRRLVSSSMVTFRIALS